MCKLFLLAFVDRCLGSSIDTMYILPSLSLSVLSCLYNLSGIYSSLGPQSQLTPDLGILPGCSGLLLRHPRPLSETMYDNNNTFNS